MNTCFATIARSITTRAPSAQPSFAEAVPAQAPRTPHQAPSTPHLSSFTLIELLTVMAIIAMLAALLFPAGRVLLSGAGKRRAAAQCLTLSHAIKSYYATYQRWPGQTGTKVGKDTTHSDSFLVLNALTNNPRGMVFLEIPPGMLVSNQLVDPWGRNYRISIDDNASKSLDVFLPDLTYTNLPNEGAAVVSGGPDPSKPSNWVFSWQQ